MLGKFIVALALILAIGAATVTPSVTQAFPVGPVDHRPIPLITAQLSVI
jgi:hypothetical protein